MVKLAALAGLLFVTVYLPFLDSGPGPIGASPTHTPTSTATTSQTPAVTNTPAITNTPNVTGTPLATGTPTTPQSTHTPDPAETPTPTTTPSSPRSRRVNAPLFSGGEEIEQAAIAWFGRVDSTGNYADVRVFYKDDKLKVYLNIFDRRLWFDSSPANAELEEWDAATLYLDTSGGGDAPSSSSHRFVAQLNSRPVRTGYQTAYQGDGQGWIPATTEFTSKSGWRGDGLNDGSEARGWSAVFEIPFASLGLAGTPPAQEVWGLALMLHDRDDATDTAIPDQSWPEQVDTNSPSTWGEVAFGLPAYDAPDTTAGGVTTVRHGLDGASVVDGHVGGHTICGDPFAPVYFDGWGDANYAGYEQLNIQNQMDVADWPCFSKFYVTFPLDNLPAAKAITSATLTLHLFGNAGEGASPGPEPSLIQVLTVGEGWEESTLTWNNAPLATENISSTWVDPLQGPLVWPGVPYNWDVSRAVARAYTRGEPLRLVLYSADAPMHSGRYFSTSDATDWNQTARPSLSVTWGEPLP